VLPAVVADSRATGVAYINVTRVPAVVRLDLVAADGSVVTSKTDLLSGKAQASFSIGDFVPGWQGTGYLRISSDAPVIALQLTSGTIGGTGYLLGNGAQGDFGKELYLGQIVEAGGWASDVTLVNLDSANSSIALDAFDPSGAPVTSATLTLGPNQQLNSRLASILAVSGQSGGSLRISANTNVAFLNRFGATGTYQGLASVEATPPLDIEERTIGGTLAADQTVGPEGGEISANLPGGQNNYLNRLHLSIPAGVLDSPTEVQILVTAATVPNADTRFTLQQFPVRLLPSGLRFKAPARLTIPLSSAVVQTAAQLQQLVALTYDEPTKTWQALRILGYDASANTVDLEIRHFSSQTPPAERVA